MLGLRLVHHFSVMSFSTVASIPDSPSKYALFVDVPQIAFCGSAENPLMNILTTSALNLRLLNPDDQPATLHPARYFCLALKGYREMLHRVSEENSCMLFASAGAIAVLELLSR